MCDNNKLETFKNANVKEFYNTLIKNILSLISNNASLIKAAKNNEITYANIYTYIPALKTLEYKWKYFTLLKKYINDVKCIPSNFIFSLRQISTDSTYKLLIDIIQDILPSSSLVGLNFSPEDDEQATNNATFYGGDYYSTCSIKLPEKIFKAFKYMWICSLSKLLLEKEDIIKFIDARHVNTYNPYVFPSYGIGKDENVSYVMNINTSTKLINNVSKRLETLFIINNVFTGLALKVLQTNNFYQKSSCLSEKIVFNCIPGFNNTISISFKHTFDPNGDAFNRLQEIEEIITYLKEIKLKVEYLYKNLYYGGWKDIDACFIDVIRNNYSAYISKDAFNNWKERKNTMKEFEKLVAQVKREAGDSIDNIVSLSYTLPNGVTKVVTLPKDDVANAERFFKITDSLSCKNIIGNKVDGDIAYRCKQENGISFYEKLDGDKWVPCSKQEYDKNNASINLEVFKAEKELFEALSKLKSDADKVFKHELESLIDDFSLFNSELPPVPPDIPQELECSLEDEPTEAELNALDREEEESPAEFTAEHIVEAPVVRGRDNINIGGLNIPFNLN